MAREASGSVSPISSSSPYLAEATIHGIKQDEDQHSLTLPFFFKDLKALKVSCGEEDFVYLFLFTCLKSNRIRIFATLVINKINQTIIY